MLKSSHNFIFPEDIKLYIIYIIYSRILVFNLHLSERNFI